MCLYLQAGGELTLEQFTGIFWQRIGGREELQNINLFAGLVDLYHRIDFNSDGFLSIDVRVVGLAGPHPLPFRYAV